MDPTVRDLRIEYQPLDTIKRDPDNPKDHDLGALADSLTRFGFVSPMAINEETGLLLWGHGRLDDLEALRDRGDEPPAGVRKDEAGQWVAPVIRGIHLTAEDGRAYIIADNRLVELGGWNEPMLVDNLIRLAGDDPEGGLFGVGFTPEELDSMAGFLHGTMEQLEDRFGVPGERDFWPVVHVRVAPDTFTLYRRLMAGMTGEDEAAKFHALISGGR